MSLDEQIEKLLQLATADELNKLLVIAQGIIESDANTPKDKGSFIGHIERYNADIKLMNR